MLVTYLVKAEVVETVPRKKVGVVEAVPRRINNQENTNNSKTISKVNIIYTEQAQNTW